MKETTFKGEISQFWSKPLKDLATKDGSVVTGPLPFAGSYKHYENIGELKAANDYPSDEEVVKFRNTQRKANERQKAMTAAVTAAGLIQPTPENDPQMRLSKMFDLFYSNIPAARRETDPDACKTEARELASKSLGIAWEDED